MISIDEIIEKRLIISVPTRQIAQMVVFIVVEMGYCNPLGEDQDSSDTELYTDNRNYCVRIEKDSSGHATEEEYIENWKRTVVEPEDFLGELSLDALQDL